MPRLGMPILGVPRVYGVVMTFVHLDGRCLPVGQIDELRSILMRLGDQFVEWLVQQGLDLFKSKLKQRIHRAKRKLRRAIRAHVRSPRSRRLVRLRVNRATRVYWLEQLLVWVNLNHSEIKKIGTLSIKQLLLDPLNR